jgi:hypothetical protein
MTQSTSWPNILATLIAKQDLSRDEADWAMSQIMDGDSSEAEIGAFMMALRSKGESVEELSGLVDVMLRRCVLLDAGSDALDIVGTGGDMVGTVNISTMASIVAAAAGVGVMKHGSRSASGKTGSAEMLEVRTACEAEKGVLEAEAARCQVQAVDSAVASAMAKERTRARMTSIVKALIHAADKKAAVNTAIATMQKKLALSYALRGAAKATKHAEETAEAAEEAKRAQEATDAQALSAEEAAQAAEEAVRAQEGAIKQAIASTREECARELEAAVEAVEAAAKELSVKPGAMMPLLRFALSGQSRGPGVTTIAHLIGREATQKRIVRTLTEVLS